MHISSGQWTPSKLEVKTVGNCIIGYGHTIHSKNHIIEGGGPSLGQEADSVEAKRWEP